MKSDFTHIFVLRIFRAGIFREINFPKIFVKLISRKIALLCNAPKSVGHTSSLFSFLSFAVYVMWHSQYRPWFVGSKHTSCTILLEYKRGLQQVYFPSICVTYTTTDVAYFGNLKSSALFISSFYNPHRRMKALVLRTGTFKNSFL